MSIPYFSPLEHRDKLHGTLATFDAVDKRIKGKDSQCH